MNTSAIIFMVLAQTIITAIAVSFLYRAIKAKKRPEPDSYLDNDDEEETALFTADSYRVRITQSRTQQHMWM